MDKLTRKEIENSTTGILIDLLGSKNLLVSFGGIQQGLGIPVFEFFNSLSKISCDKLFIRDYNQAWYQKGLDEGFANIRDIRDFLSKTIKEGKYDKTIFVGNSMGGYAAILFGTWLNVDEVIAFAPQTFIDKTHRLWYRDARWKSQLKSLFSYKDRQQEFFNLKSFLPTIEYKSEISIYYSSKDRLDKVHAERMKSIAGIKLYPVSEGGHGIVKVLRDNGELLAKIESVFS